MRAEVSLRVDGSVRVVTIPKLFLTHLGWLTGTKLVIDMDLQNGEILIRPFKREDVPLSAHSRITYELPLEGKPAMAGK